MTADRRRLGWYVIALCVGLAAIAYLLPLATLRGDGGVFAYPVGDLPTNLIGHLAFQRGGWHFPLLRAPDLAWPGGESIAMTDSNPLLSLPAKMLAEITGQPINLFGAWLALCLLLQPAAAVYALRGMLPWNADNLAVHRNEWIAAGAACMLSLLLPAFLFRFIHINLVAHFFLLAALGLCARWCRTMRVPPFRIALALLLSAIFVHPYVFMFSALILWAPAAQFALAGGAGARASLRTVMLAALLSAGSFVALNGTLGGGGPGFGLYSMNLLGPFWPQYSGIFGANLPELDATGFQHEGFNYLGAGNLFLLVAAAMAAAAAPSPMRRAAWHRWRGIAVILLMLTALAVTPRVTFGHHVLVPFSSPALERLFAVVRSSGRAFWPVAYALVLGAIAVLATRLRPAGFAAIMGVVVVLQWIDSAPLRLGVRAYLAGAGEIRPDFALPTNTVLYRTVPVCGPEAVVADEYRLMALRRGARLADARLAHEPPAADCAAQLAQGLTLKLSPGETRLFLPSVAAKVRVENLGAGTICEHSGSGVLCHRKKNVLF